MRNLYINLIVCLFICSFSVVLHAKEVNKQTAEKVAINAFAQLDNDKNAADFQVKEIITVKSEEALSFYIINFKPTGFIILSASDAAVPVLGSSTVSNFSIENVPPQLSDLLDSYKAQIKEIEKRKIEPTREIKQKWDQLSEKETFSVILKSISTLPSQVNPLLQTAWGQNIGYNRFCPVDNAGPGGHTLAGCVATAMAQIIKYWGCKVSESQTHSYYHPTYGSLSVDFNESDYAWSAMGNSPSDQYNARLIRDCGVAVNMDYGPQESGAEIFDAQTALSNYFGFKNTSDYVYSSFFTNNEWKDLLKQELSQARPILYGGISYGTDTVAHAWVIDGYNSLDNFYCNWGSGGANNGAFALTNLSPDATHNYYRDNQAVVYLEPVMTDCSEINGSNVICSSGTSFNVPGVSSSYVTWNKSSNITFDNQPGNPKTFTANGSGLGWIEATVNINGSATLDRKDVWVGKVDENKIVSSRDGMAVGAWAQYHILCNTGATVAVAGYDSNGDGGDLGDNAALSSQSIIGYEWSLPSGWSYSPNTTSPGEKQNERIDISPNWGYNPQPGEWLQVGIRAQNACGWTNWKYSYWQVISCGGYFMSISPNPSSSEATIELISTTEAKTTTTPEWELEVFSPGQVIKEKVQKIKDKTHKLNIQGWQEGVYIIRAIVNGEPVAGKLVVKH